MSRGQWQWHASASLSLEQTRRLPTNGDCSAGHRPVAATAAEDAAAAAAAVLEVPSVP